MSGCEKEEMVVVGGGRRVRACGGETRPHRVGRAESRSGSRELGSRRQGRGEGGDSIYFKKRRGLVGDGVGLWRPFSVAFMETVMP